MRHQPVIKLSGLLAGFLVCTAVYANTPETDWVSLIETDESLCISHGGRLVSLKLTDAAAPVEQGPVEVWVDRWFMQVQTADHTKQVLTAEVPEVELGCSNSIAGPQHWTISLVRRLPNGDAVRKE